MRKEIVKIVSVFCEKNNLNYKEIWNEIYRQYGALYGVHPHVLYKFGDLDKMDYLEMYEDMFGTMTKMYELIKNLK